MGAKGWQSLKKTLDYIPKDCFTIADAKRGDIGNTSDKYASAFFEKYNFSFDLDWRLLIRLRANDPDIFICNQKFTR